jgi:hypothetical protein
MASYTDSASIAAYLAVTLTPEEATQADLAAAAITTWIDHRTGRSWQGAAAVVDELNNVQGSSVYLQRPPVVAVATLDVYNGPNDWTTLDPSSYTLVDPAAGQVSLPGGYNGSLTRTDYTTDATMPPADLAYAATALAADLLGRTLNPDAAGIQQLSVGQNDISITYAATNTSVEGGPSSAVRIVDSYRRVVLA